VSTHRSKLSLVSTWIAYWSRFSTTWKGESKSYFTKYRYSMQVNWIGKTAWSQIKMYPLQGTLALHVFTTFYVKVALNYKRLVNIDLVYNAVWRAVSRKQLGLSLRPSGEFQFAPHVSFYLFSPIIIGPILNQYWLRMPAGQQRGNYFYFT